MILRLVVSKLTLGTIERASEMFLQYLVLLRRCCVVCFWFGVLYMAVDRHLLLFVGAPDRPLAAVMQTLQSSGIGAQITVCRMCLHLTKIMDSGNTDSNMQL